LPNVRGPLGSNRGGTSFSRLLEINSGRADEGIFGSGKMWIVKGILLGVVRATHNPAGSVDSTTEN